MRKVKVLLLVACVAGLTAGTRAAWHRLEAHHLAAQAPPAPLPAPRLGDSEEQVRELLGEPWDVTLGGRAWSYRQPARYGTDPLYDDNRLAVHFRDGRVVAVSTSGRMLTEE